jgi:HEAT repeat protein
MKRTSYTAVVILLLALSVSDPLQAQDRPEASVEKQIREIENAGLVPQSKLSAALENWLRTGEPAVKPLIAAVERCHEKPFVPIVFLQALGWLRDSRAVEPLVKLLKHKDWMMRANAAKALGHIGDTRAVEPLVKALNDNRKDAIEYVAYGLGEIGDEKAVKPLVELLKSKDCAVRCWAAKALGEIGDKNALQPLLDALKDDDWWVRWYTAEALGKLKDKKAVKPLIGAMKEDKKPYVRYRAAAALGVIGDKEALDALIEALKGERYVRDGAAMALGRIGDKRAVEPLRKLMKEDESERVHLAAECALYMLTREENLFESIVKTLKNDPVLGDVAAQLLGMIGDRKAVKPLIEVLKDEKRNMLGYVPQALGRIGDKEAVLPLIESLKRDDPWIWEESAEALRKTTKQNYGCSYGDWKRWYDRHHLMELLKSENEELRKSIYSKKGPDKKAAVGILIGFLKDKDKAIQAAALDALKKLTSQDFGIDHDKWKAWHEKNRDR